MNPLIQQNTARSVALATELAACQSRSRRNGKVARLPAELRHQINVMLDDGVPYKTIIERLGDAAKHITEHNLSTWRLGGFQDYRKGQLISERARAQTQVAADILRQGAQVNPAELKRVCGELAVLHFVDTLVEHGEQIAHDSLKKNPAKLITLINACCKMADAGIAAEQHKWSLEDSRKTMVGTISTPASPKLQSEGGASPYEDSSPSKVPSTHPHPSEPTATPKM